MMPSIMLAMAVLSTTLVGPAMLHGVVLSSSHQQHQAASSSSSEPPEECGVRDTVMRNASKASKAISLKALLGPYTYMDEIFHVPQAMQYALQDDYTTWDPMITTPPGAYLAGYALVRPIAELYRERPQLFEHVHHTAAWVVSLCRASNAFVIAVVAAVAKGLFNDDLRALCLVSIPPFAFTAVLYYTEPLAILSVVLVLVGYVRGVRRARTQAGVRMWWLFVAVCGLYSLTVRQTNIVWLFLVAANWGLIDVIPGAFEKLAALHEARRKESAMLQASPRRAAQIEPSLSEKLAFLVWEANKALLALLPIIAVAALFAAFLVWNDFSIVLGDKTKHEPAVHWAQIPYFFASITVFFPFTTLTQVYRLFVTSPRRLRAWALTTTVIGPGVALALHHGAMFHPYLIADNRHFPNMLYRHVLRHDVRRVAVMSVPAVFGAACFMFRTLGGGARTAGDAQKKTTTKPVRDVIAELLQLACVAVAVVPQGLLEPRYFIVPLVVHLTHMDRRMPTAALLGDLLGMLLMHAAAMWVFANRPFTAPDGSTGRLMW